MTDDARSVGTQHYLRIPHPLECRRSRPTREPRWLPNRSAATDAPRRSVAEHWREPRLQAAADTGQMRIRFSYDAWFSTATAMSEKIGRAVYFEGAVEEAAGIEAEVLTSRIDFRFQPLKVAWQRGYGKTRHLTLDAGFECEAGRIWFAEYKSHRAYLDDPQTVDLLDEAEEVLRSVGVDLERNDGSALLEPAYRRACLDVFDDRRTTFDPERDVTVVREAILRRGGVAPVGVLLEALGGPVRDASAQLNAMSMKRIVRIDLRQPQMLDTAVDIPVPASPWRLEAFLKRYSRTELD